ncbi:MAG: methyltransferase domain-containing protein [Desulfomonilaceae bacterium]
MVCRMCKDTRLAKFLDLGFTPPADRFLRKDQMREPETYYPLEVMLCMNCGLAQLSYVVSPEILYRHDYPYESSLTATGRQHWAEFAQTVTKRLELGSDDLVVDIGSNVGTLLESFRSNGTRVLGVEPASNIVRIADKKGIETLNEFFSPEVAESVFKQKGRVSVITATNVFAHVDDLDSLMEGVKILTGASGVLVVEAPYFCNLVKDLEYDTIYHEHLSYLSILPMISFFERFGMEIFDIEERDIHGGSIRVYVSFQGKMPVSPAVEEFVKGEKDMGIHTLDVLKEFAQKVEVNRQELTWLLRKLKREGKKIAGVSAPAKGMTLLNYSRIGKDTIDFITEKSTLKIGRFTPGTHIPVFPDQKLMDEMPDYALLLAWNFSHEIMRNLGDYVSRGGKFIIPIPNPRII